MREETARTVTSSASEARAHIARERDKSSSFEVLWQLAMQLKCPFTATNWTGVLSVNRVKLIKKNLLNYILLANAVSLI